MKKITVALALALAICMLSVSVFAAGNHTAFENVMMDREDIPYIQYIDHDPGLDPETGKPLQRHGTEVKYTEGYGVGYSGLGDMVLFKGLDFGTNGASEITIHYAYNAGWAGEGHVGILVDNPNGEIAAEFFMPDTGGWDMGYAEEFTESITVPAGVHDIYVKWLDNNSGSFDYVRFTESETVIPNTSAPATPAPSTPATPSTDPTTNVPTTAPAAADMGLIAGLAALAASAAGFVATKKRR